MGHQVPRVLDEEETLLASAPDDVNPRVDADDQIVDWSLDTPSPLVSVEPSPSPNADESNALVFASDIIQRMIVQLSSRDRTNGKNRIKR